LPPKRAKKAASRKRVRARKKATSRIETLIGLMHLVQMIMTPIVQALSLIEWLMCSV